MVALAKTDGTFLFKNLIPAIDRIFLALPTAIGALIKTGTPQFVNEGKALIVQLGKGFYQGFPKI